MTDEYVPSVIPAKAGMTGKAHQSFVIGEW